MRIIIVGNGKLGSSLASVLIKEGHDVTVVDRSDAAIQRGMDTLDALFIKGSGVSEVTLKEADAAHADIVIAVTVGDEINMLTCLTAKKLGARYTIARIRDPEYFDSLPFLQRELGIDSVINPERSTAREIMRMLRFPTAGSIQTFSRGRVEIVDFKASEDDPVVGIPLREIYRKNKDLPQVLFCVVERDGEVLIPRGDFIVQAGDRVHVVSDLTTITKFFRYLGKVIEPVRSAMLIGGSRIAYYLATMLTELKIRVKIIEIDPDKALQLSEMLPDVTVIQGDGTDQELLESEGLRDTPAFVTLSSRDEENLMAGIYAVHQGVKKVIVKSQRDNYSAIMHEMGLDSIISTREVAVNAILRVIRSRVNRQSALMERFYRLMDGKVEAIEFKIESGANYIGVPIRSLSIRDDCLIAIIVRDTNIKIPFGDDTLMDGDHAVIITCSPGITSMNDIFKEMK